MKKWKKFTKLFCALCAMTLVFTMTPATASAATARQKAVKIYKNFLAQGTTSVTSDYGRTYSVSLNWFRVININQKGVPELVVTEQGGGVTTYYVYTVKNNKIKYLGTYTAKGVSSTPPTITYSKKWKGLIATGWTNGVGGSWGVMYKMSGNKIAQKKYLWTGQTSSSASSTTVYYYGTSSENCSSVSKTKFTSYWNKYIKTGKNYNMKKNTAANRKKIK